MLKLYQVLCAIEHDSQLGGLSENLYPLVFAQKVGTSVVPAIEHLTLVSTRGT